jgi:hypothetical protein
MYRYPVDEGLEAAEEEGEVEGAMCASSTSASVI